MNLDEFVREVLGQVVSGVQSAIPSIRENGGTIQSRKLRSIDFDVALTVTEAGTSAKKGGITVAGINFGGEGKQESVTSTVSRVKFSVDIQLPESEPRTPATYEYSS